ncbi:MAG: hypothetical protein R3Y39_01865 [Rikenellaceae bacterium]
MEVKSEQIEFYLNKITSDKLFSRSSRHSQLLRFLVEQSVQGSDVKEYAIGQHIFGDQYDINSNDGKARVYVFNLRKKLGEYYQKSGVDDKIRFSIKSGSYTIIIEENTREQMVQPTVHKGRPAWIAALLLLMVVVFGAIIKICVTPQRYCWDKFMGVESNNLCILADQVMLQHTIGGYKTSTTHPLANNINDYAQLKKEISGDSLNRSSFTVLTKGVPYALCNLSRWFCANDSHFDMILETEVRYADIQNRNVIYIGQYKMMGATSNIFLKNSKGFSATRDAFIIKEGEAFKTYRSRYNSNNMVVDYAIVSFAPLSDGGDALFFVSNHDIGTMATVSQFTDPQFLKELYEQNSIGDRYFNALFQVDGIERNDVSCRLITLEVLTE